jgi:tetratricopeptide (TPR) repeat protein
LHHEAQKQVRGGYIDYERGYHRAAERHYRRALAADPTNREAQLGLAALAQLSGDLSGALLHYHGVLTDWPNDDIARAGINTLSRGKNGVALETELKLLLDQQPHSPHLAFVLGNVYAERKAWQAAQTYYFKAWSGDSANTNYLYNLAVSLDHLSATGAAIKFYEKLLTLTPNKRALYSVAAVKTRLTQLRGISERKGGS